jgi:hypothetical protein
MAYLRGYYEAPTEHEDKRMQARCRGYQIIGNNLYKAGIAAPLLRCISEEGLKLLDDIHHGYCGSHIGARALAAKAVREGFSWPSMISQAQDVKKKCPAVKLMLRYRTNPRSRCSSSLLYSLCNSGE